ncbi:hypothetical protein NQ117_02715 [Paenibacillus sp. SC116]|nr:hypothetical protein [Paenibacillus sp. SC116]
MESDPEPLVLLAITNPSSAEFIDYVSQWVVATLEHVDEIAVEGNL